MVLFRYYTNALSFIHSGLYYEQNNNFKNCKILYSIKELQLLPFRLQADM